MTPSALIYAGAGAPAYPGEASGICRLCGAEGVGLDWAAWVKDTFTGHDTLHPGAVICHACQHATDDRSAPLTTMTGRDKPQRMRNYSHLIWTGDPPRWRAYMKNEKTAMAMALLAPDDPPAVAVISLAGQKHLIPRARVGWWQLEEQAMRPDPAGVAALLTPVVALYSMGATKAQIESGDYSPAWLRTVDLSRWWVLEQAVRPARGSLRCQLAVWLAQKKDEPDDRDARPGDDAAAAAVAGPRRRVQEQVPHEHLETIRGPGAQRRVHDDAEPLSQPDLFAAEREPPRR